MTTPPAGPALDALNGLSVGDALGAQFFVPEVAAAHLAARTAPPGPWPWTDDTEMACSVYAAHTERGGIDTFDLTHAFALRHDFDRGYGPAANRMLRLIREGGDAKALAAELFDGQGSYGNGAAMRVAPLGAALAEDLDEVVRLAARTAVITHTHPQAVDGAIAVAVAAACAVRARTEPAMTSNTFLRKVLHHTPSGAVHDGLAEAIDLLAEPDLRVAARALGNGSRTSAADTVPYALWCAARRLDDYPAAVREAIAAGGDMDTVAAITGGVVAAYTGTQGIPAAWTAAREPLPAWAFPAPGSVPDGRGREGMLVPRPHPVPDVVWTDEQWQRIRTGSGPAALDFRWQVHTHEGTVRLCHPKGLARWEVTVARVRGGWRPVSAVAEAGHSRFPLEPDGRHLDLLTWILRNAASGKWSPLRP
ncbi:ADP-ribosylglycohydrolase family protein [Kitasatospora aureofaciens]|uniref:ADP-ribosylglycohydrolase family protein n=1 Tax=Kitasatospora aureofaciens TaxID=1894 RepID=UPI001C44911E|nr:ADP-ribosylglycohydrolase family protein [Kitasatospora aureofaciens]MBV6695941.1 ADP-ribosylglycohydrolase family protein [Kitasatospora aureofaciens]